eukprot:CAMPEP_0117012848 /NCGR_PEP_ID=MMETSP0472-20121206/10717_1 /TAXON_ID=693140 ORGANISM="Tiarina fusus, Strain LIS" /NCGR_SAMPLE_ID=MMETSP0472 /ASSEMBLY_ACC=CAM_ASM_000603 /LENGTH=246 /DNA_ID=CAMNT_0004716005 /DNA_START=127 /DNA_END=864 /DNA_ORIENTATION=-
MPKDKKALAAKYTEALKKIDGEGDDAGDRKRSGEAQRPTSKVKKIGSFHSKNAYNQSDSEGAMSEGDVDLNLPPAFEQKAKQRAEKRHSVLAVQESKLSEAARKGLLKRRIVEERRKIRNENATMLQAFVRGALTRHRVGLMVADLIAQLEAEVDPSSIPENDEPEPPSDDDLSIDEDMFQQYLRDTSIDANDSADDAALNDSNDDVEDEVIDGLRFPASLHHVNLDDLSSGDDLNFDEFGGEDED